MNPVTDGLLAATGGTPGPVEIELDVRAQRFLRDHEVGGRALLSTVMGVETMAVAVRHVHPGASIAAVSGVRVGPPYLLPATGRGSVQVALTGTTTIRCVVTSAGGVVHYTADVELGDTPHPTAEPVPVPPRGHPVVSGELVYGLYFHGPSFQVVDEAWIDGPTITARLRHDRPPVVDGRRSLTAPLLVELCLQSAGLWDLTAHDAMTIPLGIDRIRRFSALDADSPGPLHAVVRTIADRVFDGAADRVFDAEVIDSDGRVHVTVEGYRTTLFEHPYDRAAAARVRQQLMGREERPRLG